MPKRGEREGRTERGKQNALFLSDYIQHQSQQSLHSSAFCFGLVWSVRGDLEREDSGSADADYVFQGLGSKCKNYHFSNARLCTNATGMTGLCSYI